MATRPHWPPQVARYLQGVAIDVDDHLDASRRRLDRRFGLDRPRHIAAYRAFADSHGVELTGRVLARPPLGGPLEDDRWWDNLLNTYRRFNSDDVPGVALRAQFRNASAETVTDNEGYYRLDIATDAPVDAALWDHASITMADGSLLTPQPVLQVLPQARFGVISDIDDTILQSSIVDWKVAAQLVFLHNARTRKPLLGVALRGSQVDDDALQHLERVIAEREALGREPVRMELDSVGAYLPGEVVMVEGVVCRAGLAAVPRPDADRQAATEEWRDEVGEPGSDGVGSGRSGSRCGGVGAVVGHGHRGGLSLGVDSG